MTLLQQVARLSPMRRHQQCSDFALHIIGSLLVVFTAKAYIALFGANGLITKDYLIALYGTLVLLPVVGRSIKARPMRAFHLSVAFDFLAILFYCLANANIAPLITLPIGTTVLMTSNLMVSPLRNQVSSLVIAGCADYSLLKTKLDALYLAFSSCLGLTLMASGVSEWLLITIIVPMIAFGRYHRYRLFQQVYCTHSDPALTAQPVNG